MNYGTVLQVCVCVCVCVNERKARKQLLPSLPTSRSVRSPRTHANPLTYHIPFKLSVCDLQDFGVWTTASDSNLFTDDSFSIKSLTLELGSPAVLTKKQRLPLQHLHTLCFKCQKTHCILMVAAIQKTKQKKKTQ